MDSEPKNITRRKFLQVSGAAIGAFVLTGKLPFDVSAGGGEQPPNPEVKKDGLDKMGILDFAPTEPNTDKFQNPASFDNQKLARQILGSEYKTQDEIEDQIVAEKGQNGIAEFYNGPTYYLLEINPKLALVSYLIQRYQPHGVFVAGSAIKGAEMVGLNGKPYIEPLQNHIGSENISFGKDGWGNAEINLSLEPQAVIAGIKKMITDNPKIRTVNLSLQLGTVSRAQATKEINDNISGRKPSVLSTEGEHFIIPPGIDAFSGKVVKKDGETPKLVFPNGVETESLSPEQAHIESKKLDREAERLAKNQNENPGSRIIDAYVNERADINVPKLIEVLVANETMGLFTTYAVGNENDDIRPYSDKLSKLNCSVGVAEWRFGEPLGDVYGAEIYVDNSLFDLGLGSSCSSPFINSLAIYFLDQGVPINEVKAKLFELCDQVEHEAISKADYSITNEKVWVLNPDKVRVLKH